MHVAMTVIILFLLPIIIFSCHDNEFGRKIAHVGPGEEVINAHGLMGQELMYTK